MDNGFGVYLARQFGAVSPSPRPTPRGAISWSRHTTCRFRREDSDSVGGGSPSMERSVGAEHGFKNKGLTPRDNVLDTCKLLEALQQLSQCNAAIRGELEEQKGLAQQLLRRVNYCHAERENQFGEFRKEIQSSFSDLRAAVQSLQVTTDRLAPQADGCSFPESPSARTTAPADELVRKISDEVARNTSQDTVLEVVTDLRTDLHELHEKHHNCLKDSHAEITSKLNEIAGSVIPLPGKRGSVTRGFSRDSILSPTRGGRRSSTMKLAPPPQDTLPTEASALTLHEDPRQTLARFFRDGDSGGPYGAYEMKGETPATDRGVSSWFAVFRPCSSDAIQKMVLGHGCGKGLNVKGKSAKKGPLSGYVPFLQISDNLHKSSLSTPSRSSMLKIFFKTEDARDEAIDELTPIMDQMVEFARQAQIDLDEKTAGVRDMNGEEEADVFAHLAFAMDDPRLVEIDDLSDSDVYGLEIPERLLREAYVNRRDISPPPGWETGRKSAPAFCNMNIHTLRESSCQNTGQPPAVLLQYDSEDPMNVHGLLMAYVENGTVKPVVSDFDAFLIGSRGMDFKQLPPDQWPLLSWCVQHTSGILESPSTHQWSARWLHVLKEETDKGFHPRIPKYGFGDPVSCDIIEKLTQATSLTGGVRHGAECFNYYFPQEMDDEFLIIWNGFQKQQPWKYVKSEEELRMFLLDRIAEGFAFPMNPAWPLRDHGWYEVWKALLQSPAASETLKAWFPPTLNIFEAVSQAHEKCPECFVTSKEYVAAKGINQKQQKAMAEVASQAQELGLSAMELSDLAMHELNGHQTFIRARRKLKVLLMFLRKRVTSNMP